ncbi:MAG: insulinase family protein [Bacteroidota bacterium]|nr:insulinase family protein [Bacteroidota bacterium]
MKLNFKTGALLFLAVFAFVLSGTAQKPAIKTESYTLENGLTVILNEDHSKQKVFGVIAVKAGGKDDPIDATGMAHYQEHMLFKGTTELGTVNWAEEKKHIDKIFALYDSLGATTDIGKRAKIQTEINETSLKANEYAIPNELSNIIKSMGGTSLNAGTGTDQTLFFNAFPPNEIERWLELYSHRFMNPVFRGFQAELEVVYEEKNMYMDMFQTQMIEAFNFHFYKNHPYGQQTLIGTTDDLKNPSLTKMYQFFKTWYVANNMALVITGDFNTEKIKPMIAAKFGRLKKGEIPKRKVYTEEAFNGREFHEARMSPIKLGIMGFRTVPAGHKDETALKMANKILFNSNQTGLLDQLTINSEMLAAVAIPLIQNDHGGTLFLFIPKIIGQSLESAEELVLQKIKLLKEGKFSNETFTAVKQNTYKDYVLSMENLENKAVLFASIYSRGQKIEDYLNYPEKIKSITKQEVIDIANKYYGDNFLMFYSKMGKPDKQKIEKPGFKPLITNTNKKSSFAEKFSKMKVPKANIKYVDFENDITDIKTKNGNIIHWVKNPVNDIFSFEMKVGIGEYKAPMLEYAASLMNYAETTDTEINDLKAKFASLGCTYSFYSDKDYVTISLKAPEKNLEKSIILLNELLTKTVIPQDKLEIILEGLKSERKMEKSEPANVADALFEYVKYKEKSSYIDRLTLKEVKKLETKKLSEIFKNALNYETEFYYAGNTDTKKMKELVNKYLNFAKKPIPTESPVSKKIYEYPKNTVFVVDISKALQTKVYFLMNGITYDNKQDPNIEAFNQYFGGGFSGLVLQEIREYRSLAYSAGAWYKAPKKQGDPTTFYGFIGTQADKTMDAIAVFNELVRNMPDKAERTPMITHYLEESALTATPSFRRIAQQITAWKLKGYNQDPRIDKVKQYQNISYDDIKNFYKANIKEKSMVIGIAGDTDKMDMEKLKQYGEIIEIKEKNIFND